MQNVKKEKEQVLNDLIKVMYPLTDSDEITTREMLKVMIANCKHLMKTDF